MERQTPSTLVHNSKLDIYDHSSVARKTSIICTIGPKTKSVEMITKLRQAGLNVVRMNFSHGSYEYHGEVIDNTRESVKKNALNGRPVAIALDTKGPEIRTGMLKGEGGVDTVTLEKDSKVTVTTDDKFKEACSKEVIWVDYKNITKVVHVGKQIYVDDGLISLEVESKTETELKCRVVNSGALGSKKGCNLPEVDVDLPALSEKDKADLAFGVEKGVDMIFASFIRKAADVRAVRQVLGEAGKHIKIISKIENHEGMRNFDEILKETDGVMVARGDLGIEIPAYKVFIAQKMMIAKCNLAGKSIICATQMLESMTFNPRPTRAEVSDVANAVLDGADCVMLSGETAKGNYPIQAVEMMAAVCREAEHAFSPSAYLADILKTLPEIVDTNETTAISAVTAANNHGCKLIITLSGTGESGRLISKYRPACDVMVVTRALWVAQQAHLYRGCLPYQYTAERIQPWEADVNARFKWAIIEAKKARMIKPGDSVVAVHGWKAGGHFTNTMRVMEVPEDSSPNTPLLG